MTLPGRFKPGSLQIPVLLAALACQSPAADYWICSDRMENGSNTRHCSYQRLKATVVAPASPLPAATETAQPGNSKTAGKSEAAGATSEYAASATDQSGAELSTAEQSTAEQSTVENRAAQKTGNENPPPYIGACQQPALLPDLPPPTVAGPDGGRPGEDPVETVADHASLEEGVAVFSGSVQFKSGDIELRADHAEYFGETRQVELNGNVLVANPQAQLTGDRASFNLLDSSSAIESASYVVGNQQIRGSADAIRTSTEGVSTIEQGSYTRCLPDKNIWQVSASKIKLDTRNGQGSARHARLELYDVPVFYVPYARFPIGDQRQSGLLFPRISDTNSGIDIALPYYFNVAPNFDAIVAPRYKNDHGYITEGDFRWLNRFDQWQVSGAYIDSDESDSDRSRWVLRVIEEGQLGEGFTTRIDYNEVSDTEFLRDLNTTSLSVSRSSLLKQSLTLGYQGLRWQAGTKIRRFQNVDPSKVDSDVYEQLPSGWLRYQSVERPGRLAAQLELRHSEFENDTLTEAARSYGRIQLGLPLQFGTLQVQPEIGYQRQYYDFDDTAAVNTLDTGSSYGRLRLATPFEKTSRLSTKDFRPDAASHTLEPSLTWLYREATDGRDDRRQLALFDANRRTLNRLNLDALSQYTGYDVVEETNQLTAALAYHRNSPASQGRFSGTLGQVFYFQNPDDSIDSATVDDPSSRQSALVTDLSYRRPRGQALANLLWDTENDRIDQGYAGLHLYKNSGTRKDLLNIGYSFRRASDDFSLLDDNIEQAEISAITSLSRRWGLLGKYQYDLENQRRSESLAGLEYDDCCIRLRLVYRDGLIYDPLEVDKTDYDRKIFLQIELKGLMGVGSSLENALDESIRGYRSRY